MDTVLLPFVFNECSYLSSSNLVQILKETDNYYYLDDINYLTIHPHEQSLCGYFSGTEPIQLFYYVIATKDPTTENSKLKPPKEIILNCRDFEYLERFIDLICKQKPSVCRISINLPYLSDKIIKADESKSAYENLMFLMKKYEDTLKEVRTLYDFRFEDFSLLTTSNTDNKYRLTETLDQFSNTVFHVYENEQLLFQYSPNTFSFRNSIFPSLRRPAKERLGLDVLSFTDDVITELQSTIPLDAIKFCLREISSIYLARGYVVKNIAFPTVFENEDICTAIGMTKYRQFITYKTLY